MKKLVVLFSLIILNTIVNTLSAQYLQLAKTIPELTEPNPQTASLGRYGNIPIDQYKGTANISVPLYVLKFDGLDIPITLTYNTTAIKTNQEASWVGLGWTLSSEPVIIRKVNGLCDISKNELTSKGLIGFVYTDLALPQYGGIPDVSTGQNINPTTTNLYEKIRYYYASSVSSSGWDTEPDVFTLNVFGESVSFILTQKALNNGVIGVKMINNDKRYKVEYIENDQSFLVTNDRGFKFIFSVKETSVVAPNNGGQYYVSQIFPNRIITGWKLSKVISPREKILNFNYSLPSVVQSAEQYSQPKREMLCGTIGSFNIPYYPRDFTFLTGYGVYYLESITTENITVEFKGSDRLDIQRDGVGSIHITNIGSNIGVENNINPRKLDSVVVKNSLGEVTHNYEMTYSYFNNDQITESKNLFLSNKVRLKLNQIHFNGELYRKFDYINPNQLPDKTTKNCDFWGFSNSKEVIQGLYFPAYKYFEPWCRGYPVSESMILEGGNRKSNFEVAKNGLLSTITYPTGGYTKVNYEANSIKIDKDNIQKFEHYYFAESTQLATVESLDSIGVMSNIFEIKNIAGTELSLNITFGMGGKYEEYTNGFNYDRSNIKYSIEKKDRNTISYRVINVDTGKSVLTGNYTSSQTYDGDPLKPETNNKTWNKKFRTVKLDKGRYQIEAIGLRHISNIFAENEGATYRDPDYDKIYRCIVKVEASIPSLSNESASNLEVGGARIKSMEDYDTNDSLLTKKEYNYTFKNKNDESVSSGILIDELAFVNVRNHSTHVISTTDPKTQINRFEDKFIREVSSESSLRSPSSYHIGYSKVEEIYTDNQQKEKTSGKIVSEFNNKSNRYGYISRGGEFIISYIGDGIYTKSYSGEEYGKEPLSSYQDINGKLIKEEFYDKNNKLVKKTDYKYDYAYYDMPNIAHPKAIGMGLIQYQKANYQWIDDRVNNKYSEGQSGSFISAMQVYKIISEDISLLSKEDTEYLDDIVTSKKITYAYNNQFQPKKITENSSDSTKNVEIEMLYPVDLAGKEQVELLKKLVDTNAISDPISSKTKVGKTQVSNSHMKYKEIPLSYKDGIQSLTKNIVVPDIKYERRAGEIILESSDDANRTIKYDKYNSQGKLVQFTALDQATVTYLWSYNGQYPIAEIKNATYEEVKTALGVLIPDTIANWKTPDMSKINILREKLPYAQVTTYTYKPLVGILTATDPRGVTTYYDYDSFGRLKQTYVIEGGLKRIVQAYDYHYQN